MSTKRTTRARGGGRRPFTMTKACTLFIAVAAMIASTTMTNNIVVMADEEVSTPSPTISAATDPPEETDSPTPNPTTLEPTPSPTPKPTPPPTPQTCELGQSGNGIPCPATTSLPPSPQFCQLSTGTCLTKTSIWNGICAPIPAVCTTISSPVCGCNEVTYSNECEAHTLGINVASGGACSTPTPPTLAPITAGPTTVAPITMEPTTAEPTTMDPSKSPVEAPTTESPTTVAPTEEPTPSPTKMPTAKPTTESPSKSPVDTPTTDSPTTAAPTDEPTKSPSDSPTKKPTQKPTKEPTISPTDFPTDEPSLEPTKKPTRKPSVSPTLFPSYSPTPKPSRNPVVGTAEPTFPPTNKPSKSPTPAPSDNPTVSPTTAQPTASPTMLPSKSPTKKPTRQPVVGTAEPTDPPTDEPSKSPVVTDSPSQSPIVDETTTPAPFTKPPISGIPTYAPTKPPSGTSSPTSQLMGPTTTEGLTITMNGISAIANKRRWEGSTENFWEVVYADNVDMSDVEVQVSITDVQPSRRLKHQRRLLGRVLQSADSSVDVIYTQTTTYRTSNSELTMEEILQMPLSTTENRDEYVFELKQLDGYEDLTAVSPISISSDGDGGDGNKGEDGTETAPSGGLSMGAIIGIACGAAGALLLVGGFVYYRQRSKDEDDDPAATTGGSSTQDATRTGSGMGTGSSVPTYGDTSVATVDYDYSRAYGGAGAHSLSDAGGTLGSRTRQTAADDVDPAMLPGSGNTIFSDDPTFDEAYENVREELLDIYAPAGKLGVVIDTPDDGAPVVHAVKDTSPIADKVQVGDKLIAVDDEDVRAMTAIKVSKLISRKSNNASRKLTVIRHVSNN